MGRTLVSQLPQHSDRLLGSAGLLPGGLCPGLSSRLRSEPRGLDLAAACADLPVMPTGSGIQ
jgi:hypothetical protein